MINSSAYSLYFGKTGVFMSLITKDLLINFLFIIVTLFLVQILYLAKYSYRFDSIKQWVFYIFPVFSLVLCMLFPVGVHPSYVWDLRWVPFILGGLYGGYRLGLLLLALVLIIRLSMGYSGYSLALIVFPIMSVIVTLVSGYFLKLSIKNKLIVSVSLSFLAIILSIFIVNLLHMQKVGLDMWLQFGTITVIGMLFTNMMWEVMRTNFEVLRNLIKADKLQMVSHLAASISHEVRNPLTASRGFIQMLSQDIPEQTRKRYADIALQELDRATEVINDYLTFANPDFENTEKIGVSEEIHYAINVITPLANMKDISIKLSLNSDSYYVKGTKKKFQQCLINIIKNAIESMTTNGELQINQSYLDSTIQIDIRDEGIGMTYEQINRLGEPYFTTKEKGTGLGMMVSFSIIKAMGGKIHVTSHPGKGTCFSIVLPSYES